jgi:hypothetical protein
VHRRISRLAVLVVSAVAAAAAVAQSGSNPAARRLTTIEALRQFSGYYHLQNVLLRGELTESGVRLVLRSDTDEMRVILNEGVSTADGPVEVRGQLIDVGRLEAGDSRAAREPRPGQDPSADVERWPRPGEELFVRLSRVSEADAATPAPSVRALALEPWRFQGQKVTVTGNFRGKNLFGDLPGAPGKSRYDFVLRGAEGAIWVTGLRPRGRGFDLDVDRRLDSGRWVQVTGTVVEDRGLVLVEGSAIAIADAPEITQVVEEPDAAAVPLVPAEVVFSSPTEGETGVDPNAPIRIQFSRGLDEASLPGNIRVSYIGGPAVPAGAPAPNATFKLSYDGSTRAVELRLSEPMALLRTVRVEVLEGLKAFDGAPVTPFALTFTVGG